MRHTFWITGALLGALTSLPVIALDFLGQQFASLPFVPFDLFDWLARRLPGSAITLGIDTIVRTILALHLGSISASAKLIEQAIALALVLIIGAVFGGLLGLIMQRSSIRGQRAGSIGGCVLFLLAAAMKYDLGFAGDPSLPLVWLAVLLLGWGTLLGHAIKRDRAADWAVSTDHSRRRATRRAEARRRVGRRRPGSVGRGTPAPAGAQRDRRKPTARAGEDADPRSGGTHAGSAGHTASVGARNAPRDHSDRALLPH